MIIYFFFTQEGGCINIINITFSEFLYHIFLAIRFTSCNSDICIILKIKHIDTIYDTTYNIDRRHNYVQMVREIVESEAKKDEDAE